MGDSDFDAFTLALEEPIIRAIIDRKCLAKADQQTVAAHADAMLELLHLRRATIAESVCAADYLACILRGRILEANLN